MTVIVVVVVFKNLGIVSHIVIIVVVVLCACLVASRVEGVVVMFRAVNMVLHMAIELCVVIVLLTEYSSCSISCNEAGLSANPGFQGALHLFYWFYSPCLETHTIARVRVRTHAKSPARAKNCPRHN